MHVALRALVCGVIKFLRSETESASVVPCLLKSSVAWYEYPVGKTKNFGTENEKCSDQQTKANLGPRCVMPNTPAYAPEYSVPHAEVGPTEPVGANPRTFFLRVHNSWFHGMRRNSTFLQMKFHLENVDLYRWVLMDGAVWMKYNRPDNNHFAIFCAEHSTRKTISST